MKRMTLRLPVRPKFLLFDPQSQLSTLYSYHPHETNVFFELIILGRSMIRHNKHGKRSEVKNRLTPETENSMMKNTIQAILIKNKTFKTNYKYITIYWVDVRVCLYPICKAKR